MAQRRFHRRNFKPPAAPAFRINGLIRVPKIRLVGDNLEEISEVIGQQIMSDIYPTHVAQDWAREMDLDLVEISPKADPPVCRIIDFKKFLYIRKKKEKEMKDNQVKTVVKEIRLGPNISEHDFDFKLRHAKQFLESGAKVRAYVHFRGRTIVFKDRGELVLLRMLKELTEYGSPEELPRLEGRRMSVIISPKKIQKKKAEKQKAANRKNKEKEKNEAKAKKAEAKGETNSEDVKKPTDSDNIETTDKAKD